MSNIIHRRWFAVLFTVLVASAAVGCNDKSKSKTEEDDDDKSSSKKKKSKKDKKSDDDDGDDDDKSEKKSAKKSVEVPGTKGFVVPGGGKYEHKSLKLGDKTLEMDTYAYPVKDFPRPALRKSFADVTTKAGWKLAGDPSSDVSIKASKDGQTISVLIGEANAETTQLNVMPPINN